MSEQAEETQVAEPEAIDETSVSTEEKESVSEAPNGDNQDGLAEGENQEQEKKPDDNTEKESRYAKRQAQIDKKIWQMNEERRRLREEREAWERAQVKQEPKQPNINEYDDHEKYISDLHKYNAEQIKTQAEKLAEKKIREQREREWFEGTLAQYNAKRAKAVETNPDYETYDVRVNQILQAHNAGQLVQPLLEIENNTDVVSYLGRNPDEAERIAQLPPYKALMELGGISKSLMGRPVKKQSSAPPPINPVAGSGNATRDPNKMSFRDFEAMRNKQIYGR